MKETSEVILNKYMQQYGFMRMLKKDLVLIISEITECCKNNGKILICGNGGSNADADHIAGELMKGFMRRRRIEGPIADKIACLGMPEITEKLQGSLPVINLGAHTSLVTAVANDIGGEMIFAQQVMGYGRKEDLLLGITTSGNSKDVIYAGTVAKAKEMKTILLTGRNGGKAAELFDYSLKVPADFTADIQDMHSVIYHAVCMVVENEFWDL